MDVLIKNSDIEGKGAFANKDFKKGELILKWNPLKLDKKEIDNYPKKYIIVIGGKYFLMQPPERYVNHSCEPNSEADMDNLCDKAIRDIKKGEEITVNYGDDEFSKNIKCNCGNKNCKKDI
jgi:SET domain-containing protein